MSEPTLEQKLVIDPQAVMSHFCWAYTDALLKGLEKLMAEGHDTLFPYSMSPSKLNPLVEGIVTRLQEQLGQPAIEVRSSAELEELCVCVEFTLGLFEKK